jgi:hypothetical protein
VDGGAGVDDDDVVGRQANLMAVEAKEDANR